MCKRIAIIGDRNAIVPQCQKLKNWLDANFADCCTVITGGAKGVDEAAMEWANWNCKALIGYLPDYSKYGKAATHVRNSQIIKDAEVLIAYQPNGKTPGTQSTIKKALAAGLEVIELDGNLQDLQTKPNGSLTLFG